MLGCQSGILVLEIENEWTWMDNKKCNILLCSQTKNGLQGFFPKVSVACLIFVPFCLCVHATLCTCGHRVQCGSPASCWKTVKRGVFCLQKLSLRALKPKPAAGFVLAHAARFFSSCDVFVLSAACLNPVEWLTYKVLCKATTKAKP